VARKWLNIRWKENVLPSKTRGGTGAIGLAPDWKVEEGPLFHKGEKKIGLDILNLRVNHGVMRREKDGVSKKSMYVGRGEKKRSLGICQPRERIDVQFAREENWEDRRSYVKLRGKTGKEPNVCAVDLLAKGRKNRQANKTKRTHRNINDIPSLAIKKTIQYSSVREEVQERRPSLLNKEKRWSLSGRRG